MLHNCVAMIWLCGESKDAGNTSVVVGCVATLWCVEAVCCSLAVCCGKGWCCAGARQSAVVAVAGPRQQTPDSAASAQQQPGSPHHTPA